MIIRSILSDTRFKWMERADLEQLVVFIDQQGAL